MTWSRCPRRHRRRQSPMGVPHSTSIDDEENSYGYGGRSAHRQRTALAQSEDAARLKQLARLDYECEYATDTAFFKPKYHETKIPSRLRKRNSNIGLRRRSRPGVRRTTRRCQHTRNSAEKRSRMAERDSHHLLILRRCSASVSSDELLDARSNCVALRRAQSDRPLLTAASAAAAARASAGAAALISSRADPARGGSLASAGLSPTAAPPFGHGVAP